MLSNQAVFPFSVQKTQSLEKIVVADEYWSVCHIAPAKPPTMNMSRYVGGGGTAVSLAKQHYLFSKALIYSQIVWFCFSLRRGWPGSVSVCDVGGLVMFQFATWVAWFCFSLRRGWPGSVSVCDVGGLVLFQFVTWIAWFCFSL